jgi:protocatechuate 3,4-dioxygenase beta subunit
VTDADGIVQFTTVYPGWYRGRTVHIHAKVHLDNATALTTQLFFDDEVSDGEVYTQAPYDQHTGRDTTNVNDGIFLEETVLSLSVQDDGYLGVMTFTIDG